MEHIELACVLVGLILIAPELCKIIAAAQKD
jgi:hypothetical protein